MNNNLVSKYNVPGPRYTSYPTVPYWDDTPSESKWIQLVNETFNASNDTEGISIYIHLPYCESLCTYCGCNTRITVNHAVEMPYIQGVLREWNMYLEVFKEKPRIREIHLGGGTPTFFSAENLSFLIKSIQNTATLTDDFELSFEAHPRNTTKEHLRVLASLGAKRLSLGIQDFDEKVQQIINRIQSVEMVESVVNDARELGYTSINFDLIYGLPKQTKDSVRRTIELVKEMKPERIAFYSYAHVPWIKPGQRSYTEQDLPTDQEKRALYELGKTLLEDAGYHEIGMDHFALTTDDLYNAMKEGKLHRNFMGYTSHHTSLLVGLGTSAISDCWTGFVQNKKTVESYLTTINQGKFPYFKGHELNVQDLWIRKHILNLMCHFKTSWYNHIPINKEELLLRLEPLFYDRLINLTDNSIEITEAGKPFVRNICMCFDEKLHQNKPETQIFSQTV